MSTDSPDRKCFYEGGQRQVSLGTASPQAVTGLFPGDSGVRSGAICVLQCISFH